MSDKYFNLNRANFSLHVQNTGFTNAGLVRRTKNSVVDTLTRLRESILASGTDICAAVTSPLNFNTVFPPSARFFNDPLIQVGGTTQFNKNIWCYESGDFVLQMPKWNEIIFNELPEDYSLIFSVQLVRENTVYDARTNYIYPDEPTSESILAVGYSNGAFTINAAIGEFEGYTLDQSELTVNLADLGIAYTVMSFSGTVDLIVPIGDMEFMTGGVAQSEWAFFAEVLGASGCDTRFFIPDPDLYPPCGSPTPPTPPSVLPYPYRYDATKLQNFAQPFMLRRGRK